MNRAILSLFLMMIIAGCAVGPDYKRPEINSPQTWRVEEAQAKDTANTIWWSQFNDPVLNSMIDEALKQNYDLLIATARVEEYMGRYWVGRSGLFPQLGASAFGGKEKISEEGLNPL